jgi:hypothetical protein
MASDTVFLLAYDTETGDPHEWNLNYTPIEVFNTAEDREKRVQELINMRKNEEDYDEHSMFDELGNMFVKIDRKMMTKDLLSVPQSDERLKGYSTVLGEKETITWVDPRFSDYKP